MAHSAVHLAMGTYELSYGTYVQPPARAKVVNDGHVEQLQGRAQSVIEEPSRAKAHLS